MRRRTFLQTTAAGAALVAGRNLFAKGRAAMSTPTDPLLAPWVGPHGGFPPFDKVAVADFKPALLKAMDLQSAEIAAITAHTDAPTFENTLAPLEDSGRPLNRAQTVFSIY